MSKRKKYPPTKVGLVGNEEGASSSEPLYGVWNTMLARCYNPGHNRYHRYGGRGIQVCEEWHTYLVFRAWATSAGYRSGLSIDREHTDGPYSPENCRWVSPKLQQQNRSNNRQVTWQGETKSLAAWADDRRCAVSYSILWDRVSRGWEFEKAMSTPQRDGKAYRLLTALGETKGLTEWTQDPRCEVRSIKTLHKRLKDGWPHEKAILTPVRKR